VQARRTNRSSTIQFRSAVAGAATDARKTASATRHAARTRELSTGATADAGDAALAARTAARTAELAARAAVTVGVAAAATGVLFEDDMRCRAASHCRSGRESFSCCHRRNSNRCSNSATNDQRFNQIQFR
jgi:hypothetical protein